MSQGYWIGPGSVEISLDAGRRDLGAPAFSLSLLEIDLWQSLQSWVWLLLSAEWIFTLFFDIMA